MLKFHSYGQHHSGEEVDGPGIFHTERDKAICRLKIGIVGKAYRLQIDEGLAVLSVEVYHGGESADDNGLSFSIYEIIYMRRA